MGSLVPTEHIPSVEFYNYTQLMKNLALSDERKGVVTAKADTENLLFCRHHCRD